MLAEPISVISPSKVSDLVCKRPPSYSWMQTPAATKSPSQLRPAAPTIPEPLRAGKIRVVSTPRPALAQRADRMAPPGPAQRVDMTSSHPPVHLDRQT